MAKILITGGSGLVGHTISELLLEMGHKPCWLSREAGSWRGIQKYKWSLDKKYIDLHAFDDVESVIHLAGAGIVDKRWTRDFKKEIIDSRVKSTELLWETVSKNTIQLKSFVGASAVGYYGSESSDYEFTEMDLPGRDFLAKTCIEWENSYKPFSRSNIRTTIIRTGIVLSEKGGAYAKMLPAFKFGLGAGVGKGSQFFPWIHINDLANIFIQGALNPAIQGVYNAAATESVTNHEFSKMLAESLRRPFFLPNIPEFVLKLALGERAIALTSGLKISNEKIKATGFKFEFDNLKEALNDLSKTKN
jgi:uncharacterized protein